MANSAAMELKVLISILQSGTALPQLLNQVNQLSTALNKLQSQSGAGGTPTLIPPVPPIPPIAPPLKEGASAADKAAKAMQGLESSINRVIRAAQFMAGGFLALQSVRFLRSLADAAAKNQVLGTVMHVVAVNAGILESEIDKVDKKVQKLGITVAASRQALTQFMQARLDLAFAPALARAAQDLAVIADMNSSDTFRRLIVNIQQLDTLGLRMMGLVVDRTAAEKKYQREIGATTRELTKQEQQTALMIGVLDKAKGMEGAYSSAMNDVQKQLGSLDRLTETYKSMLGEQLLPAYSAIVAEVTVMYEKLIILAAEFNHSSEGGKTLADVAREITQFFTGLAVTLMENLETIITLVKWFVILKGTFLVFKGLGAIFGWITFVIDLLMKLRIAFIALQTAGLGWKVAMQAMGAASAAEAVKLIQLAAAQQTVQTSTNAATASLVANTLAARQATLAATGLMLAWGTMAAVLAIPVVAYIYYKLKAEREEREKQPILEQAAELKEQARKEGVGVAVSSQSLAWFRLFEQWKEANPKIVDSLRTYDKLMAAFNEKVEFAGKKGHLTGFISDLEKAKQEQQAAMVAQQEMLNPPTAAEKEQITPAERTAANERLDAANKKVREVKEKMDKAFEAIPGTASTREIGKVIDEVNRLQAVLGEVRKKPMVSPQEVLAAESVLEVRKAEKEALLGKLPSALEAELPSDPEMQRVLLTMTRYKAGITAAADAVTALQTAQQQVFGGALEFTEKGVTTKGFGTAFSGYRTFVDQATKAIKETGTLPVESAQQLTEGLEKLGETVKKPLDLTKLRGLAPEIAKLGEKVPGLAQKYQEALRVAELGEQRERLSFLAPVEQKNKERIKGRADLEQAAAQKELDLAKTRGQFLLEEQQFLFNQQLIGLREYHRTKREVIEADGQEELRLQDLKIQELQRLAVATRDPDAKRAAEVQVVQAQQQRLGIKRKIELDVTKDINQEETDRIKLYKDLLAAELDFAAQHGGQKEAIDKLNNSLDEEAKKYRQLGADAARFRAEGDLIRAQEAELAAQRGLDLIEVKRLAGQFDILNKVRDRAHQIRLGEIDVLKQQVDLQEKHRAAEAARVEAGVAGGTITEFEARQFRNEQIQISLAENRRRRAAEALTLAANEAAMRKELLDIEQQGLALKKSQADITKDLQEKQQQWNGILQGNKAAILDLDAAYVTLAASAEQYGKELKKAFVDEFSAALTESITNFKNAGETWINMSKSISNKIVSIFAEAFSERLFRKLGIFNMVDRLMDRIFGGGSKGLVGTSETLMTGSAQRAAEGGIIVGPGTGTSDSIPAWVSAGEHIMPAAKTAQWLPLLEGIRTGKILPFVHGGVVQSIAMSPVIPRRYASGGVVVSDGGASAVQTGGGVGNMIVQMHPDTLNMTMRDWLEHEVVRQQGRR